MLTRTAMRSSAIEVLRTNDAESQRLLRDLSEYGILMVPPGFLRETPETFPRGVWIRLFELIKTGELAHRTTEPGYIESRSAHAPWERQNRIEVILDENRDGAPLEVDCLPVVSFPMAFHVERCKNLRNKEESCAGRDDLWNWVLEPLLDGLFKSQRVVTICDSYLVNHVLGIDLGRDPVWHGLTWLLNRIESNSIEHNLLTEVRLVGRERDPDGGRGTIEAVRQRFQEIFRTLGLSRLKLQVTVVPESAFVRQPGLSRAFHDRFVMFGTRRAITFGSGLDNLTRQSGDLAASTLSRSWNYAAAYGEEVGELLVQLQRRSGNGCSFLVGEGTAL